jgi:putative cell wall-binding protein
VVADTTRVAGADRWTTAAAVNQDAFTSATTAYLVNGFNFPDGLSAAPIAGKNRAPVFVSDTECVPRPVLTAISRLGITTVTLGGGTGVLTSRVESLTPCP